MKPTTFLLIAIIVFGAVIAGLMMHNTAKGKPADVDSLEFKGLAITTGPVTSYRGDSIIEYTPHLSATQYEEMLHIFAHQNAIIENQAKLIKQMQNDLRMQARVTRHADLVPEPIRAADYYDVRHTIGTPVFVTQTDTTVFSSVPEEAYKWLDSLKLGKPNEHGKLQPYDLQRLDSAARAHDFYYDSINQCYKPRKL